MDTHYDILILGGGTAGLTVASQLADRVGGRHVAIVEPSSTHYYQPLWTLVGGGIFPREDSARDEADLIPDQVTWIRDAATSVDPENRSVTTLAGGSLTYDFLVVAPGVVLQWTKIPGLAESVGKFGTGSPATTRTRRSQRRGRRFDRFGGGTALFTEPITPVKCGGAPQKIMYLAEEAFRANGVREASRVVFMNAKPTLFSAPTYIPALERVIKTRGMEVQLGPGARRAAARTREAVFRDTTTGNEQVMRYDMIHVTPPMSAPDFIRSGPLAECRRLDRSRQAFAAARAVSRRSSASVTRAACRRQRRARRSASRRRWSSRTCSRFEQASRSPRGMTVTRRVPSSPAAAS